MTVLSYAWSIVWSFVLLLSILVFVHELGHYLVARACGVRVLKFSIGFGPPIGFGRHRLTWTRGGTEFVIAWFPLGGFVKMLGENPDEADDPEIAVYPGQSLPEKSTWQKLAIVFAGPAANLILPVIVFTGVLAMGIPRPVAVVGSVAPGSPAADAGLHPGDKITGVAGKPVTWWSDVEDAIRDRAGYSVALGIDRGGVASTVQFEVQKRAISDEFSETVEVGWAGIEHTRPAAMLGIAAANSPASAAGLRSGDLVQTVNGAPVASWDEFAATYAAATGADVQLGIVNASPTPETHATVSVPALGSVEALGVLPATVLVAAVTPDSAAHRAGLDVGDLIVAVDGAPLASFEAFRELVRTSGGRPLAVQYARNGELHAVQIAPTLEDFDAGFGIKEPRYLVGITGRDTSLVGATSLDRVRNPLVAVPRAVEMTVKQTQFFLKGLAKIVTGEVSRKQLAGPLGIAEIAGNAARQGWESFVSMLVFISINLGVLNLLPIPVLDGGQAVIYAIEGIRRGPLSLRTREIVSQFGVTLLLLLMGFALWNDLTRQWTRLLDWISRA